MKDVEFHVHSYPLQNYMNGSMNWKVRETNFMRKDIDSLNSPPGPAKFAVFDNPSAW
jgi:hypothetical protein